MKNILFTLAGIFLFGVLQAQTSEWKVSSADYEYSMTLSACVESDDSTYGAEGDSLAAFVNGECRGVAEATWVESYDTYMFFLTVFSNTYQGEQVSFKYYNASSESIMEGFFPAQFEDGRNMGTASEPMLISDEDLHKTYKVTFSVSGNNEVLEGVFIFVDDSTLTTDASGIDTIRLASGTYDYQVSAEGFEQTAGTITVEDGPETESIFLSPVTYDFLFTVVNGSRPIKGADISVEDLHATTNGDGEATVSLPAGNYSYTVVASGYEDAAGTAEITGAGGVETVSLEVAEKATTMLNSSAGNQIGVYPSPAYESITVLGENIRKVEMINLQGKMVIFRDRVESGSEINVTSVIPGIYVVKLTSDNGNVYTKNLIVQ